MVWYSHLLKNFPEFVVIHTVKGFGIVNKAEVDVFLELLQNSLPLIILLLPTFMKVFVPVASTLFCAPVKFFPTWHLATSCWEKANGPGLWEITNVPGRS